METKYYKKGDEILKVISETEMQSIRKGIGIGMNKNVPKDAFEGITKNYEEATQAEWNLALDEVRPIINAIIGW